MDANTTMMAILPQGSDETFVRQVSTALGLASVHVVSGSPGEAAHAIQETGVSPIYLIIDIGERGADVLSEIDTLAEFCSTETRAVVIGNLNDITFYREIINRGVVEYFPRPAKVADVCAALSKSDTSGNSDRSAAIISFMGAASGDGSSTIALNTAYALANCYRKSVVIIDMDFQFGMLARTLDLTTPYGIKEIFAHPGRVIDSTLLSRMLVRYNGKLNVIAAPNDLGFWPEVEVDMILGLLNTLKERFDYIILDLPHIWSGWTAAALGQSTQAVMVAQLWLRSVTHTARLLSAWKDTGIEDENVNIVINRSGARFKEALTAKDYETITHKKISYFFANDIRAIAASENEGKTITEMDNNILSKQIEEFAGLLIERHTGEPVVKDTSGEDTKRKDGFSPFTLFGNGKR